MRISIIANSVALRMRPPRKAGEATYAEHLRAQGHDVSLVARSGVLLDEAFATLEEDVLCHHPDLVIINFGVVETCYRQTVRWVNNQTIRNYYLNLRFNRPYEHATPLSITILYFWRVINALIRLVARCCGLRWQWVSTERFLATMEAVIQALLKETNAKIVIIGVNPGTGRVERILPGTAQALVMVNRRLEYWVRSQGSRVAFLDPGEFVMAENAELLVPDGVHFSAYGHCEMARGLGKLIERLGQHKQP